MQRIVYTSPFVPAEWVAAHGLAPCRLTPAGTTGPVASGLCPFANSFLQEAGHSDAAGIILTTTCDAMRRGSDILPHDARVFTLHVPRLTREPSARRYYREELERLSDWMVDRGGHRPDTSSLRTHAEHWNQQRQALRDLAGRCNGRPLAEAAAHFNATGQVPDITGPTPRSGIPVGLVGGPLTRAQFDLYDHFATAGLRPVVDATEGGLHTLAAPLNRRNLHTDPLEEIVAAYFDAIPGIFRLPDTQRQDALHAQLTASAARGLVLLRPVWCDMWHAEVALLRERLSLPVLDLDLDGGPTASRRLATRLGAFAETLS